jgi:REP element-mobilizing transposase RayT
MAQTLTRLLLHIVFSTKNRDPFITEAVATELHKYLAGIARNHDSPALAIGGVADHIHLLISLSKNIACADLLMHLKRDSSKWIKSKGPEFATFAWQEGYGAFTIGESQVDAMKRYIANQEDHHRTRSFQDEFRDLLAKYGVDFDENLVWG